MKTLPYLNLKFKQSQVPFPESQGPLWVVKCFNVCLRWWRRPRCMRFVCLTETRNLTLTSYPRPLHAWSCWYSLIWNKKNNGKVQNGYKKRWFCNAPFPVPIKYPAMPKSEPVLERGSLLTRFERRFKLMNRIFVGAVKKLQAPTA